MAQLIAITDYGSGNLHSAAKAFERMAVERDIACAIEVTDDAGLIAKADRIVLPGVGAFADCLQGVAAVPGLIEALEEAVLDKQRPFLGICVGMQLLADVGLEHGRHRGFGWLGGEVARLDPPGDEYKIPHMGWNELSLSDAGRRHPVFSGIADGDHVYFVHSYAMRGTDAAHVLATSDHGVRFTAAVGRDNIVGVQFHPEKSQAAGLRLIGNFLEWTP